MLTVAVLVDVLVDTFVILLLLCIHRDKAKNEGTTGQHCLIVCAMLQSSGLAEKLALLRVACTQAVSKSSGAALTCRLPPDPPAQQV